MRFRLRTLLIVLAVAPVVIYYFTMRHFERADAAEQLKDRQTREALHSVRAKMEKWIRTWGANSPTEDQILWQWRRLLTDDKGEPMCDAWGRPLTIGWRGFNNADLYAKSAGINGIHDGFGDNNGDDIEVHLWLPMYGLKRPDSLESEDPNPMP